MTKTNTLKHGSDADKMSQTMVSSSVKGSGDANVPKTQEMEGDESSEEEKVHVKRKTDTDCKNLDFEQHIKERRSKSPPNFTSVNRQKVHEMNTGRPLKERIEVPEGFEIYQYGN
jgi:hypothetical protein